MQDVMRNILFHRLEFTRYDVCEWFQDYIKHSLILEQRIEFIHLLDEFIEHKELKNSEGYVYRSLRFKLDPIDTTAWNEAMDSIYKEVDHE